MKDQVCINYQTFGVFYWSIIALWGLTLATWWVAKR
jgi:hypothetical protein